MAKKSKIVREQKLIKKVQKYAAIRAELKGIIKDPKSKPAEKKSGSSTIRQAAKNI